MNDTILPSEQAKPKGVEDLADLLTLALRESLERNGRIDPPQRKVEDMAAKTPKVDEPTAKPAPTGGCAL